MSGDASLRVEFSLAEEDFLRFLDHHRPIARWTLLVSLPVVFGSTVPGFTDFGIVTALWCGLFVAGVFAAVFALAYPWMLRLVAKRVSRRPPWFGLMGPYAVEVSPAGLFQSSAVGEAIRKWGTFDRIVATPTCHYFSIGRRQAIIIPNRAFASREEAEKFVRAAQEWEAAARA